MQFKPSISVAVCLWSIFAAGGVATSTQKTTMSSTSENLKTEATIRTAYAKMSYADEVRILVDELHRLGRENWWKSDASTADAALSSRLAFQLSNFQFGKISDIADRRIGDFDGSATAIGGEVLSPAEDLWNYTSGNSAPEYVAYIEFKWKPSPRQTVLFPENWPISISLQLPELEGKKYTDYATYTVTVTFQGKSRTYSAWMLSGPDGKRRQQVYFMDYVTDPTAIHFALEHSLYPAAFVKGDLRTVPFIDKWLNNNSQACDIVPRAEKDDNRPDVCCDIAAGRCGISRSPSLSPVKWHQKPSTPHLLLAGFHASPALHPFFQSSCSQFSGETFENHGLSDTNEHETGQHTFASSIDQRCTYTGSVGPCSVSCEASGSSTMTDVGTLTGIGTFHATAIANFTGSASANGGNQTMTCQGTSAGTVKSCLISCSTSISITASGSGVGATINFPATQIWSDQNTGTQNCVPETAAPACGNSTSGGASGDAGSCGGGGPVCTLVDGKTICVSPIVIDAEGEGFHLTSAEGGVMFDIKGDGHPIQMGWTDQFYHNAFLALPGPDGLVHNGKQLFGNFTPQPPSDHPNGFLALAEYDKPENGGNEDGIIDASDAVFAKLRLWIDENHDGVCQPGELHPLPELGVYSLALRYTDSHRADQFGNQFRYKARVNPGLQHDYRDERAHGEEHEVGRWTYDVFFTTE